MECPSCKAAIAERSRFCLPDAQPGSARDAVTPSRRIYAELTEDFGTPDPQEAKALLGKQLSRIAARALLLRRRSTASQRPSW